MAGNLPDVIEQNVLNALIGNAAFSAPTTPMKVRLMTVNGTDSTNGTEVTGGSYVSQTGTFDDATLGPCANDAVIDFVNMPACVVVGVEVWDTAGTPKRFWYGATVVPKSVELGDTFRIEAGDLALTLD